jgi:hypothetical protein
MNGVMPYKSALLVLTLAVIPSFYVNTWLGMAAAVAAYVVAAKIANRQMDRVFLIRTLKNGPAPPKI